MNALVTAGGGNNKEEILPTGNMTPAGGDRGSARDSQKHLKRMKLLCLNCKALCYHLADKCYELEANNNSHCPGWNSVLAAAQHGPGTTRIKTVKTNSCTLTAGPHLYVYLSNVY